MPSRSCRYGAGRGCLRSSQGQGPGGATPPLRRPAPGCGRAVHCRSSYGTETRRIVAKTTGSADVRSPPPNGRIRCQGRYSVFDVGLSAMSGRAERPFVTSATSQKPSSALDCVNQNDPRNDSRQNEGEDSRVSNIHNTLILYLVLTSRMMPALHLESRLFPTRTDCSPQTVESLLVAKCADAMTCTSHLSYCSTDHIAQIHTYNKGSPFVINYAKLTIVNGHRVIFAHVAPCSLIGTTLQ